MPKKIFTKNNLIFTLKHSIFSLSFYYFMLVMADLVLKGAISRKLQLGMMPILVLFLGFILAFLNLSKKSSPKSNKKAKFLFFILTLASVLILFVSYLPHDPLVSASVALVFFFVVLINKKSILNKI
jgi:hypothetical protein